MKIRRTFLTSLGIALAIGLAPAAVFAEAITETAVEVTAEGTEAATETVTEGMSVTEGITETEFITESMTEVVMEGVVESETSITELTTESAFEAQTEGISESIPEPVTEITVDGETETAAEEENHLAAGSENGNTAAYHADDVAVIRQIIANSATLTAKYGADSAPDTWNFVKWDGSGDSQRITTVYFYGDNVTDYVGSLDVSGLTSLQDLSCYNNPGLTSISIPTSLNYLDCSSTGITALDVSDCTNLNTLSCLETPLTELDVSTNTSLSTLYINGPISSLTTPFGNISVTCDSGMGSILMNNFIMENKTVDIVVTPNPGYTFYKWEGLPETLLESISSALLYEVSVSDTLSLTANFGPADDRNNDGYHDGDVAVIQTIIQQSPTLSASYSPDDPASWKDFLYWTPIEEENYINRVEKLQLSDNFVIDNITDVSGTLDVSGLSYLHTLWCHDNPGITDILLPSGSLMDYLNCTNTGISSLNVSDCPGLEVLYCHNTKLTMLDISKNPLISEVSLSNNPELTWLITGKGEFTFFAADGGEAAIEEYDPATGNLSLSVSAYPGYYPANHEGLPENAQTDGNEITFPLTGYTHVIANFLPYDVALLDLYMDGVKLSPEFDPEITEYTATVKNSVKTVSVHAVPNDADSYVGINGKGDPDSYQNGDEFIDTIKLKTGKNVITVTVASPHGDLEMEYTITITRQEEGDPHSHTSDTSGTSTSASADSSASGASANTNADTSPAAPDTGDGTMLGQYAALMAVSMMVFVLNRKKLDRL